MHLRPRTPARLLLVCACVLLGPLLLAACGEDTASSDGGGDPVATDDLVTLRLDVATQDQDVMRDVTQVVQRRLDALGVERSDLGWDGSTIEVLVPGGDEAVLRRALAGPGALEFRPVRAVLGEAPTGEDRVAAQARLEELRALLEVPDGVTAAQIVADEQAAEAAAAGSGAGAGAGAGAGSADQGDGGEAATTALNQWGVDVYVPEFAELFQLEGRLQDVTPAAAVAGSDEVTLVGEDGTLYLLGPTALAGGAVRGATAELGQAGNWTILLVLKDGADGIDAFNEIAAQCAEGAVTCPGTAGPSGQLAIVVDGAVVSAPTINTSRFEADQIQISGSFDETTATALAAALDAGVSPAGWTLQD